MYYKKDKGKKQQNTKKRIPTLKRMVQRFFMDTKLLPRLCREWLEHC